VAATRALIEATEYCATHQEDAAHIAAKAFRIPEADMQLYMTRLTYRVEMPKDVVTTNFREAAEFARSRTSSEDTGLERPHPTAVMQEAAPDRHWLVSANDGGSCPGDGCRVPHARDVSFQYAPSGYASTAGFGALHPGSH